MLYLVAFINIHQNHHPNFRTALKEARELNEELKEIVGEKAESTQEYASLISSQRQEIENLRKVISENNLEVILQK